MKKIITFLLSIFLAVSAQADKLKVVTTLSTFGSIVKSIGADEVDVQWIGAPRFNPHFIEAKPSDVLRLKRCNLFVHAGLDLEAWRQPLVEAAARSEIRKGGARELDLSAVVNIKNIPTGPISRADGDIHLFGNPHYWLDPQNGKSIARSIASKLSELLPAKQVLFNNNLRQFEELLDQSILDWRAELTEFRGREVLGYHDEWIYLIDFMGLKMDRFVEPKPGIMPGPKQILDLENYIQANKIPAIVQATYYSTSAAKALNKSTGVKLVQICQSVLEMPECSDYLRMLQLDISRIIEALK